MDRLFVNVMSSKEIVLDPYDLGRNAIVNRKFRKHIQGHLHTLLIAATASIFSARGNRSSESCSIAVCSTVVTHPNVSAQSRSKVVKSLETKRKCKERVTDMERRVV